MRSQHRQTRIKNYKVTMIIYRFIRLPASPVEQIASETSSVILRRGYDGTARVLRIRSYDRNLGPRHWSLFIPVTRFFPVDSRISAITLNKTLNLKSSRMCRLFGLQREKIEKHKTYEMLIEYKQKICIHRE